MGGSGSYPPYLRLKVKTYALGQTPCRTAEQAVASSRHRNSLSVAREDEALRVALISEGMGQSSSMIGVTSKPDGVRNTVTLVRLFGDKPSGPSSRMNPVHDRYIRCRAVTVNRQCRIDNVLSVLNDEARDIRQVGKEVGVDGPRHTIADRWS